MAGPAERVAGASGSPAGHAPQFSDRVAALVEKRESQVVLGLDPDPSDLWPVAVEESRVDLAGAAEKTIAVRTAAAVERHCRAALEAVASACVAVKLQLACFERLGAPGWQTLHAVAAAARDHGLLVIADGKRGDVPITARAYADGLVGETPGPYGPVAGLGVDAFTVNPLLGRDSLGPFVAAASAASAGCFVLVRTSNPGAADFQDGGGARGPLYEDLGRLVDDIGSGAIGARGLSSVGAVVGATQPERIARLRELMPQTIFLLPGVGAQGGVVEQLAPAFAPHPAAGLITASRSIVDAHRERGGDPAVAAATAATELRMAGWSLVA